MFASILYRTLCAISIPLCIIPINWHVRNNNTAASFLIIYLTVFNIIALTNASIWPSDVSLTDSWDGAIFCDIEIKVIIWVSNGHLGAIAALAKNLADIMSNDISVIQTKPARRKKLIIDLLYCVGIPSYMCTIHYVVQPSRYWLLGIRGCAATVDNSWPVILLVLAWGPVLALVAGYYSCLVIYRLRRYQSQMSTILSRQSAATATKSRFLRLTALAFVMFIIFVPIVFSSFIGYLSRPLVPYSWDDIHGEEWKKILKVPTGDRIGFELWIPPISGIIVFLFFGLGKDAYEMYREWCRALYLDTVVPGLAMKEEISGYRSQSENREKHWDLEKSLTSTIDEDPPNSASTWTLYEGSEGRMRPVGVPGELDGEISARDRPLYYRTQLPTPLQDTSRIAGPSHSAETKCEGGVLGRGSISRSQEKQRGEIWVGRDFVHQEEYRLDYERKDN